MIFSLTLDYEYGFWIRTPDCSWYFWSYFVLSPSLLGFSP